MKQPRAVVTLAVGEACYTPWKRWLQPGWERWCKNQGYELVVFDQPLDTSARAQNRSMAWQKLLAMASPQLQHYHQALWLDADVWINHSAADPLDLIPPEQVGMALDCGSPLATEPEWFRASFSQVLAKSLQESLPASTPQPFSYLDLWGFNSRKRPLYNTGVIGFTPALHAPLFQRIYDQWSDGGPGALHEMIPLNLELQQRRLVNPIQPAFNMLFGVYYVIWQQYPNKMQAWLRWDEQTPTPHQFAQHLANRSHFLHFAGCHSTMQTLFAEGCF